MEERFKIDPAKGHQPDLETWVTNQAYVPRNLIAVVTRKITPFRDDEQSFSECVRAILELHPISIKGFWTGFSEMGPYEPEPTIRVAEKYGRPVDRMLMYWRAQHELYAHGSFRVTGDTETRLTKENVTVDVMFIEPDPTHTAVVNAWHGIELYPATYDGLESKRDLMGLPGPLSGLPSAFKGFRMRNRWKPPVCKFTLAANRWVMGEEAIAQAQAVLNGINLAHANPYERNEFVKHISDDVLAQANN